MCGFRTIIGDGDGIVNHKIFIIGGFGGTYVNGDVALEGLAINIYWKTLDETFFPKR